ncbi:MAG: TolC family protein, partial [Bacteroidota bacterium]
VQDMELIAVEITSLYFEALIAQLNLERAQFNLVNNDTIYTISKGRYSVGKIAENELLQSELSYMNAQASVEQASISYDRAIQRLKTALGLSRENELDVFLPPALPQVRVSPEYAQQRALEQSPLIKQLDLRQFAAKRDLQRAKLNGRFSANLNASFGLNQTGSTLSESYQKPVSQQAISLGVSIPIIQWGQTQAEIDAALANLQSTELTNELSLQEYRDDVYYQVLGLRQLYRQLEISARSDTVAQKRYEITKNRYLIGKVDIQSLFIAQAERDAAQTTNVANLRAYYLALANLRATTLYDFIGDRPIQTVIKSE